MLARSNANFKRLFYFVPALYILLHSLEELPGFETWVGRHFGTHPTLIFAIEHIFIVLIVFFVCHKAATTGKHSRWLILATAFQVQFGINALFHLTAALLFVEYSPGMMTAGILGLPLTYYFIRKMSRERYLAPRELLISIVLGLAIAAAVIGVLFLDL